MWSTRGGKAYWRLRSNVDTSDRLKHALLAMSTITVAVPDPLDAALTERMKSLGARSKEEYLLSLVEADCAVSELDQTLLQRLAGPFIPLPDDWLNQVKKAAVGRV